VPTNAKSDPRALVMRPLVRVDGPWAPTFAVKVRVKVPFHDRGRDVPKPSGPDGRALSDRR